MNYGQGAITFVNKSGAGGGGGTGNETIFFTNVATLTLPWNAARIANFGTSGNFLVEIIGDDGIPRNTFVEIIPDSIAATTSYHFDFGGLATGRITIS